MDKIELPKLNEEKKQIISLIIEYLEDNKMGYIKVPTGWGKTFLAKHIMKKYYEQGKVVLFVVSANNQLLDQTFYKNVDNQLPLFPNSIALSSKHAKAGINDLKRFVELDNNPSKSGKIIFASLQSINNNEELRGYLSQKADMVIIDEIHNFIENKGNTFIEEIDKNNRQTKIFGMTATPFQGVIGHLKFVEDISAEMNEIFSKNLSMCIAEGQLAELNYTIIRNNESILDLFDFTEGLKALEQNDLYINCASDEHIDRIIRRTNLAKRIYDEQINTHSSKTLIFCAPTKNITSRDRESPDKVASFHAKICAAIFNKEVVDKIDCTFSFSNYKHNGFFKDTVYLCSEIPNREQNEILKAFKTAGKPPFVLCTVGMLTEGFDYPDLENLILLRPTLSMRLFEQQIGRVLRLPSINSEKTQGNIFEISDNIDCLYNIFKENVFEGNNLERINMLYTENKLADLLIEDNNTKAHKDMPLQKAGIHISDLKFAQHGDSYSLSPVEIPPINLRIKHFYNLMDIIENKYEGKLEKETRQLMRAALTLRPNTIENAREIQKLIIQLEQLESKSRNQQTGSYNYRKYKPELYKEVKWLLKLSVFTYIKYSEKLKLENLQKELLETLGYEGDPSQIDNYRIECLNQMCPDSSNKEDIKAYCNYFETGIKNILQIINFRKRQGEKKVEGNIKYILPNIYQASCLILDEPEIGKVLSENKNIIREIKNLIKGQ
ncbi:MULTISPECIES: DEAD/DEAH box helicase [Dehalococcoides]|uniref:Putative DNA or RNA helicase of superfamily II n=1 Tax=Dehalococcoides mccartyi TaxID=61435 RepID=A0A142VBT1_9CHLR|nr:MULTISPECIES: DEAD/DEAH box helicase [Dehalococcoides]AGG07009.1 putative DNA or RNA helicase of superfamily II [Dehalococcoides mccartyi DCMB5]AMU87212.1 putative DNA or RNA helicase of superfamily II [Dehalococcoides mccartyi]RAL68946.1 putative DNA or RNA helicase of superfamily II [Dehalococcoides mccartyi]RAL70134.1 putative DNA or RNA helicase of superfamily II [Dehalococcoides mccartyi]